MKTLHRIQELEYDTIIDELEESEENASLIELKEKLKNIYAEHETYLRLIFKFIAAFIALILIKSNIGFMKPINMWIVIAGAAVVCMFLSWGAVSVVLAVDIIVNVFAVSLELGILMLTVMIIVYTVL
ncbi:MAG: hypothetical protein ACLT2Z_02900 [Eubacterium sp.]